MKVSHIAKMLDATTVQPEFEDTEVATCYTSDLLSDVMANAGDATVLITIQAHKNSVAVASLNDISAIVLCNNRPVPEDMREAAAEEGIAILVTAKNQFQVSGLLYAELNAD